MPISEFSPSCWPMFQNSLAVAVGPARGSMAPLATTCVQEGAQIGIRKCTGMESPGFLGRNFLVMSAVSVKTSAECQIQISLFSVKKGVLPWSHGSATVALWLEQDKRSWCHCAV